jgi:hypothetical protein
LIFGANTAEAEKRPPFLGIGLLQGGKRLRRLLLARKDLNPELGEPESYRRFGQCLDGSIDSFLLLIRCIVFPADLSDR